MKLPTICIPRICANITQHDIFRILELYNFGKISNIDIVNGNKHKKVFIKYSYWNTKEKTKMFRRALNNGEEMNPFLIDYDTPYQIPPFEKIEVSHYEPAFDEGMKQHLSEIEAITNNKLRKQMGKTAKKYYEKKFSSSIAFKHLNLLIKDNY